MVTSGFFNSLNGDRKYNADQMSAIFDGIINDGVYASIGTSFGVRADVENNVTVGVGRAWFNSTWIYNDSILPLTADISELLLDRYDAVIIEVDRTESVRRASIKIVKGTPSSNPQYPTLTNAAGIYQYPLAYIYRKAGSTAIAQSDITNMIGTSSCPYVTGIIQSLSIDNIVAQWSAQWDDWYTNKTEEMDNWTEDKQVEIDAWYAAQTKTMTTWTANKQAEWNQWFTDLSNDMESWTEAEKTEWNEWSAALQQEMNTWTANRKKEWDAWFASVEAETEAWTTEKKAAFDTWFAEIRDLISTDSMGQITDRLLKLEDGTTPAGKALKAIGDENGANIAQHFDTIQTTSQAILATSGWYRVAEFEGDTNAIKGRNANSCEILLRNGTTNHQPSTNKLYLTSLYGVQKFIPLLINSYSDTNRCFNKIRYTYDNSKAYIEAYYFNNGSNPVQVEIQSPKVFDYTWKAITPTFTSETVDGVTVTTTYDIPANASPVTDLDLETYRQKTQKVITTLPTPTEECDYFVQSGDSTFPVGFGLLEIRYAAGTNEYTALYKTFRGVYFNFYGGTEWYGWNTLATTADLANYAEVEKLRSSGLLSEGLYHSRINATNTLVSLLDKNLTIFFSNWTDSTNFPFVYGSGVIIPTADTNYRVIMYSKGSSVKQFAIGSASKTSGSWVVTWDEKASAEDCLPKIGGDITGNVAIKSDEAVDRLLYLQNSLRSVYQKVGSDGIYQLYDKTNSKPIIFSTADGTNTFNGTATGNLPLTDAKTNGTFIVGPNSTIGDNIAKFYVKNSARSVSYELGADGQAWLWDYTNDKAIVTSKADGTNIFNGIAINNLPLGGGMLTSVGYLNQLKLHRKGDTGDVGIGFYLNDVQVGMLAYGNSIGDFIVRFGTDSSDESSKVLLHTGNVGSYALPKSGGTIISSNPNSFNVESTTSNAYSYWKTPEGNMAGVGYYEGLSFIANEKNFARIGINTAGTPQYWTDARGSTKYDLIHTGNSAKVAIQPSAPTDTSALWVY